jgi:hypothetical protein
MEKRSWSVPTVSVPYTGVSTNTAARVEPHTCIMSRELNPTVLCVKPTWPVEDVLEDVVGILYSCTIDTISPKVGRTVGAIPTAFMPV